MAEKMPSLPRCKAADGKTYEYNPWFHSYREVDEHREMTAADLGLKPFRRVTRIIDTDAPYSFWLGADHG